MNPVNYMLGAGESSLGHCNLGDCAWGAVEQYLNGTNLEDICWATFSTSDHESPEEQLWEGHSYDSEYFQGIYYWVPPINLAMESNPPNLDIIKLMIEKMAEARSDAALRAVLQDTLTGEAAVMYCIWGARGALACTASRGFSSTPRGETAARAGYD